MGIKQTIVFVIAILSSGCTQLKALPHLDQVMTLKDYSEEKDAQAKWIDGENKKFERLLTIVKNGSISGYPDQNSVLTEFGKPVVSESVQDAGSTATRWLYRHPIQKSATDRVYLYFDADGQMIRSEHIPAAQAS
jgi:hypothetical protein